MPSPLPFKVIWSRELNPITFVILYGMKASHQFCPHSRGGDRQGKAPGDSDHGGCPRILLTTVNYGNNVLNVCLPVDWMLRGSGTECLSWFLLCFWYLKHSRSLWWLTLCVNWIGLCGAQAFGQTLFWVCLWGCFSMRWTFEPRTE